MDDKYKWGIKELDDVKYANLILKNMHLRYDGLIDIFEGWLEEERKEFKCCSVKYQNMPIMINGTPVKLNDIDKNDILKYSLKDETKRMTIEEAINIKTGQFEMEKILSEFKQWLEDEIAEGIIKDRTDLAKFQFGMGSGVLHYGEENKAIVSKNKTVEFEQKITKHITSICEKYKFEFDSYGGEGVSVDLFEPRNIIIGGTIRQKQKIRY